MKIVLGSASPRRRELISKLNIPFAVVVSGCDEDCSLTDPEAFCAELSKRKAEAVRDDLKENPETPAYAELVGGHGAESAEAAETDEVIVLGSDTVVACEGHILGKPVDEEDAFRMIRMLSGRDHHVFTGVSFAFMNGRETETFVEDTAVHVVEMTDEEIRRYISSGEPMDKAGSYGIQGLFAPYIDRISGEYANVVGLPIAAVRKHLMEIH